MTKLCILTQDENNKSVELLKESLEKLDCTVILIQYDNERATDKNLSWKLDEGSNILKRGEEEKPISDFGFDGVMVRAWGTAPIAAKFCEAFENEGIVAADETKYTKISDSKIR